MTGILSHRTLKGKIHYPANLLGMKQNIFDSYWVLLVSHWRHGDHREKQRLFWATHVNRKWTFSSFNMPPVTLNAWTLNCKLLWCFLMSRTGCYWCLGIHEIKLYKLVFVVSTVLKNYQFFIHENLLTIISQAISFFKGNFRSYERPLGIYTPP